MFSTWFVMRCYTVKRGQLAVGVDQSMRSKLEDYCDVVIMCCCWELVA
jgi:hypothetical protein